MPPSGYNQTQADCLQNFLASCFVSLCEEARGNNEDIPTGLEREIYSITCILDQGCADYERAALCLTRRFYESMLEELTSSGLGVQPTKEKVLRAFRKDILAIHVPSISALAK